MLFSKKQILKRLNSEKTPTNDKKLLELFYLEEAKQNEKELAKLTRYSQKQKAIKKFGENGLYFEDLSIYYAIQKYTLSHYYNVITAELEEVSIKERTKELNKLTKNKIIKEFSANSKGLSITVDDNRKMEILLLSETLLKNDSIVKTVQRAGKCHISVSDLCWELPFNHTYVTGYECKGRVQESKLHTWVEFLHNGNEKVIDYTMNVVMDKKDYYSLMHIKKVCTKIECEEIKNNFSQECFKKLESYYDMKYVLTSWSEVLKEVNANIIENKNKTF